MAENNRGKIKKSLQDMIDWFATDTVQSLPIKTLKETAEKILQNIIRAEKLVQGDALNKTIDIKNTRKREKQLQEIKHINLLKERITQGYIFVQKLRGIITKENFEYLLLFNDANAQKIGKFSLEDILPTLNIVVDRSGQFNLQINNLTQLAKLKSQENAIGETLEQNEQEMINLFNELLQKRRERVIAKRTERETIEDKEKRLKHNGKISGFEIGQEGIAFEIAVRRFADKLLTGEDPSLSVDEFRADTQAFYVGGDVTTRQAQAILKLAEQSAKIALELKVVRSSTRSGYSVGARLTGSSTVRNALTKIIEILTLNPLKEDAKQQLQKFYSQKEDPTIQKFENIAYSIAKDNADSLIEIK